MARPPCAGAICHRSASAVKVRSRRSRRRLSSARPEVPSYPMNSVARWKLVPHGTRAGHSGKKRCRQSEQSLQPDLFPALTLTGDPGAVRERVRALAECDPRPGVGVDSGGFGREVIGRVPGSRRRIADGADPPRLQRPAPLAVGADARAARVVLARWDRLGARHVAGGGAGVGRIGDLEGKGARHRIRRGVDVAGAPAGERLVDGVAGTAGEAEARAVAAPDEESGVGRGWR